MGTLLLPQIEELELAIDSGDREMFLDRYNVMIQTCNQCHVASDYGAVKVTVPELNPFNQDFNANK
jgi:cytochrome c553